MRGRRPDQQDSLVLLDNFLGVHDLFLLGLFDGHAGSASAEWAARRLPMAVSNALKTVLLGPTSSDKSGRLITQSMLAQLTKEQSDKVCSSLF